MPLIACLRAALARVAFGAALFALACSASIGTAANVGGDAKPRNIIIMIADGAAGTQWDFGRYSSRVARGQSFATTDVVFRTGAFGLLTTSANDAYVTDSAAAASAMSTGHKANNGAIAMGPDGKLLQTVMEAARASGKRIGLVTTAPVYDATPAAFTIHEKSRYKAQAIVDQYAAFQPEVLLGGGADYFLPRGKGAGKRNDSVDLMGAFQANGYTIARSAQELKSARGRRLLGLFADADMMFEIDAENGMQPSLADMAVAALKMLEPLAAKGFVLLIENENVDTAGHANDAAALMRALWAFDDAVKVALDFQRRAPDTLLIVTGDHETGGFSPTAGGDAQLRMLARITISLGAAEAKLGSAPSADALDQLLKQHFPGFTLGADARERILKGKASQQSGVTQNALASMVAKQAGYSWATTGHTSEPVAVGAIGPGAELFRGYQDNADFGKHLHTLLRARTVSGEP